MTSPGVEREPAEVRRVAQVLEPGLGLEANALVEGEPPALGAAREQGVEARRARARPAGRRAEQADVLVGEQASALAEGCEPPKAHQGAVVELVANRVGQVLPVGLGRVGAVGQAPAAGLADALDRRGIQPRPTGPHGEDERQPGPVPPGAPEVDARREPRRQVPRGVADDHRAGLALGVERPRAGVDGEHPDVGPPERAPQQDLREDDARAALAV